MVYAVANEITSAATSDGTIGVSASAVMYSAALQQSSSLAEKVQQRSYSALDLLPLERLDVQEPVAFLHRADQPEAQRPNHVEQFCAFVALPPARRLGN